MTFTHIVEFLVGALGAIGLVLFREGGPYNPVEKPIEPTPAPPPMPVATSTPPTVPVGTKKPSMAIYEAAKANLDKPLTLNPKVPKEVGCCQAVSFVLRAAGYKVPKQGISGVNALIDWMLANGFEEIDTPVIGAVITAHRKARSDPAYAHTGVYGKTWIMSNDSRSGLFQANYTPRGWNSYFKVMHTCEVRYFVPTL